MKTVLLLRGRDRLVDKTMGSASQGSNSGASLWGGSVVKNLPANAGDPGSIPGPGISHTPWSNKACVPQLLNARPGAQEPQLLKPERPRARALQQEKPLQ